jgi:8-oxo-dGTP pyrophosphatase MutT (NUDIX family)
LIDHATAEEEGIPQACVYIACVDRQSRIYIQHRSKNKKLYPDLKTISASGHVNPGESFLQAAKRELKEELNIEADYLKKVGEFHDFHHCGIVYEVISDKTPIPNADELDTCQSGFGSRKGVRSLIEAFQEEEGIKSIFFPSPSTPPPPSSPAFPSDSPSAPF